MFETVYVVFIEPANALGWNCQVMLGTPDSVVAHVADLGRDYKARAIYRLGARGVVREMTVEFRDGRLALVETAARAV